MSETDPVIVRKYGNRRLYRTDKSCYVTLNELAAMVQTEQAFVVQDAKTDRDLTGVVLAQILLESQKADEGGGLPLELLRRLIRLQEPAFRDFVAHHLPRLMALFLEDRAATRARLAAATGGGNGALDGETVGQLQALRVRLDQVLAGVQGG